MSRSVAIVTDPSSGIGRATAIRLSRDFSAVVLVARRTAELREVADQVKVNGAGPLAIDLDLTVPAAAETIVSQTLAKLGRIDALLNIAAAVPGCDLFQMTDEQWNASMELKLHGVQRQRLLTQASIVRYGESQDVAELMAFLVSPAARWTGTQLRIDGGEMKSISFRAWAGGQPIARGPPSGRIHSQAKRQQTGVQ
jgi:NAD(P)-dependent dehydrogenase (short-subunit alcohol dehydrogenase family)